MNVKFEKILIIALQIIVSLIENIIWKQSFMQTAGLRNWTAVTSIMIIVNIVIQVISLKTEKKLFTFGSFFIFLSYLVHCSYSLLLGFNFLPENSIVYTVHLFKHEAYNYICATKFAVNSIAMLFIGYIAVAERKEKGKIENIVLDNSTAAVMKNYGLISAIGFGLIFYASTFFAIMHVFSISNYSAFTLLRQSVLFNISLALLPFYFSSLFMLAVYYKSKNRKKAVNFIIIIVFISVLLSYLTGSRIRGTFILITLFILWVNNDSSISFKNAVIYILVGIFILQTFYAIRVTRSKGFSVSAIIGAYFGMENSVLFETLSEFGVSIFVTAGFMHLDLTGNGWDFIIKEVGSVLPRVSEWGGDVFNPPTLRTGFEGIYALGTTYIADLYYYFGNLGQYIVVFYGVIIAVLDNKITKWQRNYDFIAMAVAIPGIYIVLSSVRAPATSGLKMFLYSFLIYKGISFFLIKKSSGAVVKNIE